MHVTKAISVVALLLASVFQTAMAAPLVYADGDLAPQGSPDGQINIADLLLADKIAIGLVAPTPSDLSHGDLYPTDAPDGVINIQDVLLLQQKMRGAGSTPANQYVQSVNIFEDGPSSVTGEAGGNIANTTLVVDGYTAPGAIVINDPNFTDPEDATNTIWRVSVSNGIGNVYIGTDDLSGNPLLDTGFDLSGDGDALLVFDIKVNSIDPGAVLTVKVDSGYPDLGQEQLTAADYTVGSWRRVAVNFADLLADPGPGAGLDLENVVNIFVIEVTGGSADFYLDNIFVTHACQDVGVCNATIKTKTQLGNSLGATATASTTGAAGGPGLAVDGNITTRWESVHGIDPSWLTLDLGGSYSLTDVIIYWEAANAATYEIQGSNDNTNWTTLSSQSGGAFGDRTDNISVSGTYRYVRMNGLTRTSPYGYSIYEMEVYGTPGADADGDGIDDSIDQCPGTPSGNTVAANGCIDSDGDGVDNTLDQCPSTAPGIPVDAVGCSFIIPVNEVAAFNDILIGGAGSSQPGLTLYVFDNDLAASGTSTCNGGCATSWPPLLVTDGVASGAINLGTITRADSTTQATYNGRPLYFFAGDSAVGDTSGDGAGGVWHTVSYAQTVVPLFNTTTVLEPALQEDTPTALITRLADRARDRHAREEQYQQYDHYLSFYWEHRTAEIEIVDTVGKGGNTITFNVTTEWPVNPIEAELRFFHLNEAIYANNGIMTAVPELDVPGEDRRHYTRSVDFNPLTGQPLQVGDLMEFELSQFLTGTPNFRDNYYGTAILYVVGQGVEPWEGVGVAQNPSPMPAAGRLGGDTTLPYQYSDEPDHHFQQMSTNLSNINGQTFVLGRRVHHTDFGDGSHDESTDNADFTELANTLGTNYVNRSCISCHARNGRAIPPAVGQSLDQYLVKVGDANGFPDPNLGSVLQPQVTSGSPEGGVSISGWTENNGLRSPNYSFTGSNTPTNYSARIAPQLVGMGLLEAIDEADIQVLADPNDSNSDGISGRVHLVTDAETNQTRIGRFGWKASQATLKQQVAAALNTDVGVMTSILPNPDCGAQQTNCGATGSELADEHLDNLTAYIALLGLSARRDLNDAQALQGEALFNTTGCNSCHIDSGFQTSQYHPHAELRDQTIYPYTDMLLHDMGPGLASNLPEGDAAGAEWRTAPLWNIGLTSGVSGGEGYLHDGRARTLDEAIRWHGGEADASRLNYEALSQSDKDALIRFLESL